MRFFYLMLVGATIPFMATGNYAAYRIAVESRSCADPLVLPPSVPCKTVVRYLAPGDSWQCPYGMDLAAVRSDEVCAVYAVCVCGKGD